MILEILFLVEMELIKELIFPPRIPMKLLGILINSEKTTNFVGKCLGKFRKSFAEKEL